MYDVVGIVEMHGDVYVRTRAYVCVCVCVFVSSYSGPPSVLVPNSGSVEDLVLRRFVFCWKTESFPTS